MALPITLITDLSNRLSIMIQDSKTDQRTVDVQRSRQHFLDTFRHKQLLLSLQRIRDLHANDTRYRRGQIKPPPQFRLKSSPGVGSNFIEFIFECIVYSTESWRQRQYGNGAE